MEHIKAVTSLIASYKKLPGIGNKTAERLAYASLSFSQEELDNFISSLKYVKENVHKCSKCGMYIDTLTCPICDDSSRDDSLLMVVNNSKSVFSFEKTNKYHGKYFILKGLISPIKGIGAEQVGINELIDLLKKEGAQELIIALDSTLEGEITSQYIYKLVSPLNIKITRLAYGLPIGADIEYVDERTIELSLLDRKSMKEEN